MERAQLKALNRKVDNYIQAHASELLNLCCDLIKAKSENPPGDVSNPTQIAQTFMEQKGIAYEKVEPRPGRINTIASIGSGRKTLILCGHVDTVPAGDESKWSFPHSPA